MASRRSADELAGIDPAAVERRLELLEEHKRGWQRRAVGMTMPDAMVRASTARPRRALTISVTAAHGEYLERVGLERGLTPAALLRAALTAWMRQENLAWPPGWRAR